MTKCKAFYNCSWEKNGLPTSRHAEEKTKGDKMTKKSFALSISISMIFLFAVAANAEQSIVGTVANGCKAELETYCQDVTPGEGRILACLYSRSDKLSGKCEYALYDAAVQLERGVAKLSYVVNECAKDLNQFCSEVEVGEGRLLTCLEKNGENVSERCKYAVEEVVSKK